MCRPPGFIPRRFFIDCQRILSRIVFKYLNKYQKESDMNAIPAQENKRRGIAAVDDLIAKGDLHVIRNNQPQYVVLSEERYQELIVAEQEAYYARVRASLEDIREGRVKRGTADDLIKELKLEG